MKRLASCTSLVALAVALVVPFTVKAELSTSPTVELTYIEPRVVEEEIVEEVMLEETSQVILTSEKKKKDEVVTEEAVEISETESSQVIMANAEMKVVEGIVEEIAEEIIEETVEETVSNVREEVVDYALSFVGGSYVFGGTNPNTGVDCSGFTQYVMKNAADVEMNRTSTAQSTQGETVSADEMQPGDLVFYSNGSSVNHVAMYIGDGQVVHASTEKTGIKVSNWDYRDPVRIANVIGE